MGRSRDTSNLVISFFEFGRENLCVLKQTSKDKWNILHRMVWINDFELLKQITEFCTIEEMNELILQKSRKGQTPFMIACYDDKREKIGIFIMKWCCKIFISNKQKLRPKNMICWG